mgnify:CR=1 FL=1
MRGLPALDLVGTSAPGDVWSFTNVGPNDYYSLTHDNGTATNPARQPVPAGLAASGGEFLPGVAFIERDGANDRVRYARLSGGTPHPTYDRL